ncbi:Pls/PosA family non-ribosomal peptide synthetase [Amycolatopsis umgeniensis]|uniref:Non-ribosomal peptide synthetase-like protein n=1 Tax=Amycolatopsis umgeniensis TaxID=336628 RepID=A0A841AUY4_9PSEU|nr:Pls/PosA family non-ribosomal peptide synthetase [Amycolatopsis umgeniensis]MBB5849938.1 non-ribosomal peptide synthetase-like protein [Amycolatopsis umgeniensis]
MSPYGQPSGLFTTDGLVLTCDGHGQQVRWRAGERLEQLYEGLCDRLRADGLGDRLAVDTGSTKLTFAGLDERANRLARHLRAHGVLPGDRIGLLFDEPVHPYVAMLAVLKINAAYVPLDTGFPDDRLDYIVRDAGVRLVVSISGLRDRFEPGGVDLLCLDEEADRIAALPGDRLSPAEKGVSTDELCYIVYTSGSTGRPKGVTIDHAAICNFVRVAADVYGIQGTDRVYQGMTIAFDFSVEEIWVPLLCGATLVPKPGGVGLVGHDLHEFLRDNEVTALCCVPTLLASLDEDLPRLRFLLVSGEACPEDLVRRWYRPDRRFLNVYGPTEATVTATWAVLRPDRPVTIGVPLPTYSVVILDPDEPQALAAGELGEIGIAGIGLAGGYLNRPDLTERAFIPDFLGIGHNPSGRIYRTGDLGRVTPEGEIEYHGRADTQVKIRGYRVELTEIESVLLQIPGIAQAVVETHHPEAGRTELVAYYSLRRDRTDVDAGELRRRLGELLPGYMVPAYLERLEHIPLTPAGKADRKNLPAPTSPRSAASAVDYVAPATETEQQLADALGRVLGVERISATGHFFDDYGADSLLLAKFCALVRERGDVAPLSARDVYLNPTVRGLAELVPASAQAPVARAEEPRRAATGSYVLCGLFQLVVFLAYAAGSGWILDTGFIWVTAATGFVDAYARAVGLGLVVFTVLSVVPILAKWALVGRWKPGEIPLWSPGYLRFWLVKTLVRFSPLMLFTGTPLYSWYLRALGADIGKGAVILSRNPPVCTDLLTIGAGAVIRKDAFFPCYRARAGWIQTGSVTLGENAFVGEMTVLDIGTTIGDDAQLGHSSSLNAGQTVPDGESWHGSPARLSTVDYRALATVARGWLRPFTFCVSSLLLLLLVTLPATLGGVDVLADRWFTTSADFTSWVFYRGQIIDTALLYFGALLAGLAIVLTLPRLLSRFLRPDRVYPLYGAHFGLQRLIARLTNLRSFTYLFGDSSYIVYYLRGLGYDLSKVQQTGSNFGVEVKHESPFLSTVGTGTMVSDGLSLLNADFSASSFRLRRTAIAPQAFLGNEIAYPPDARVGRNCLLATKVLVPLDGPVRENVGLLGSPAFEIPRTVRRDTGFEHLSTGEGLRRSLRAKLWHNTGTLLVYLLVHWLHLLGVTLIGIGAGVLHERFGALAVGGGLVATLLFTVAYFVLAELAVQGFKAIRPRFCSIYDPIFWRHERYWKLSPARYLALFDGTPFKSFLWRCLGVRIGRRVFDDGCAIPERSLVSIGDDCVLNLHTVLQGHSLEDGTFKSDYITVGAGCTIGTGAFVHYGVTMAEGAIVETDAFLMKGTTAPARTRWHANPAVELDTAEATTAARRLP